MTEIPEDSPMDLAPLDGLASAFSLPDLIAADPVLLALHGEVVTRMRREAMGLPMKTVQTLLIERIAFTYVDMLYKERNGLFKTARDQKEQYSLWVSMTQEFNRLLEKHNDKLLNEMLIKVQGILAAAMPSIKDNEDRKLFRRTLQEAFAEFEL